MTYTHAITVDLSYEDAVERTREALAEQGIDGDVAAARGGARNRSVRSSACRRRRRCRRWVARAEQEGCCDQRRSHR